ncbi:MAG: AMP-dependent synthetase [Nitrospinae bacterium CG22_combo_CG10-13_8_21_14_all_47_10]|nr:MAG: AMP-dependent synthetase [Nitrospinae bacterium CG22_combo_CG10-13_8_21_14_all_47_10]
MKTYNISASLAHWAKEMPDQSAIIEMRSKSQVTFRQLEEESNLIASGLLQHGMKKGDRVLVMVPYGMKFVTLTFALFKAGAVPVLIDPGLGKKKVLHCIKQSDPRGIIAVPLAHAIKTLLPTAFKSIQFSVTVGRKWFWRGSTLDQVKRSGQTDYQMDAASEDQAAAVLFTSGSTGPAKGVLYTHGMFDQQTRILRQHFGILPGEKDLPTFPLFGLFTTGMGMTSIIPDMDPTCPARVNPENIIRPIQNHGITSSFGSPALWDTVSRYCQKNGVRLSSLRRILIAGAPVSGTLLKRFESILEPDCKVLTPYGATEALPITSIERQEIVNDTWAQSEKGEGTCVGRPVAGAEIKIIRISEEPILNWQDDLEISKGQTGEIVVRAPWVTKTYFNLEDVTRLAKIPDGETFWHRMGDVGKWDEQGRLWFCGRKSHRVVTGSETLFTIPCEALFNQHPDVRRSALVGKGSGSNREPVIIIEPENMDRVAKDREAFVKELLAIGAASPHTRSIKKILFHSDFPVDVRHNAKIFREKLAVWAESQ